MNIAEIYDQSAIFCGQVEYSMDLKASKRDIGQYRLQEIFQSIYDLLHDGFILGYVKQGMILRSKQWNDLFNKDLRDRWIHFYAEQREKKMGKTLLTTICSTFLNRMWMTFVLSSGKG
ncbi:hypothetical protein EON65_55095 [archaeon]|nr:MAG: hypothetical protein EON65_55095 [archaeon]